MQILGIQPGLVPTEGSPVLEVEPVSSPGVQNLGLPPQRPLAKSDPQGSGNPAALTRTMSIFLRMVHPLDVLAANGAMVVTGATMLYAAAKVIAAGCLNPTPVEPVTCVASLYAGGVAGLAGAGTLVGAYRFLEKVTLPAIKEGWGLP